MHRRLTHTDQERGLHKHSLAVADMFLMGDTRFHTYRSLGYSGNNEDASFAFLSLYHWTTWLRSWRVEGHKEGSVCVCTMATHSSILAWRIPWTEEPGRLQSMASQRVGHSWVTTTWTHSMLDTAEWLPLEHTPSIQDQRCYLRMALPWTPAWGPLNSWCWGFTKGSRAKSRAGLIRLTLLKSHLLFGPQFPQLGKGPRSDDSFLRFPPFGYWQSRIVFPKARVERCKGLWG